MPDVKGLLSDPEFQKLDPATQKSTLGKLDPEFSSLTDDQFDQFKKKISPKKTPVRRDTLTGREPGAQMSRPSFEDQYFDAAGTAASVMGAGELGGAAWKAITSGAVKQFLKSSIPKLVAGAVGGTAAKKGAEFVGASPGVADAVGVAGGVAGMYGEGKIGEFLRSIPEDVAKGSWLNFTKWLAEKAKTDEAAAKLLAESKKLPTPYTPKPGSPDTGAGNSPTAGTNPAMKRPAPGYRNPPARSTPSASIQVPPSPESPVTVDTPQKGVGNPPGSGINPAMKRPRLEGFRNRPAGPKTFSPATAAPGSTATVDASKVKEAAEMVKSLGATPESLKSAPQSQWDAIGKQLQHPIDENFKKAVIEEIGSKSPTPKPSPKAAADIGAGPKTPKPTPGGAKVESTVTPEARAARAEEHATKLATAIRKTLAADKIPEPGNDAAWKVLEDQTGTEATPAVRKSAIDKARKLWSEGPRSAGDLQRRRAEHFAKTPPPQ